MCGIFSAAGPAWVSGAVHRCVTLPDPVVQLDQQLHRTQARTILTYRSDNPDPPYLRVYALDLSPATGSWALYLHQVTSLGPDGQVPGAPGLQTAQSRLTRTNVTVAHGVTGTVFSGSRTGTFLPLPYPAVRVQAGGGWAVDPDTLMMWSANSISGLEYNVTSKDVEPTPQELRDAPPPSPSTAQEAMLPTAYSSLSGLAHQITHGAVTRYGKAVALQHWFTAAGNFTYSLNRSEPNTVTGLEDFLLHTKRGFCQQFAFAFAALARLLGIPARVAVGYTAGTELGKGNWRVTTSDAHAWPELFFQGAGWLRWEPTPSGIGTGQGTAKPPTYTVSASSSTWPWRHSIPNQHRQHRTATGPSRAAQPCRSRTVRPFMQAPLAASSPITVIGSGSGGCCSPLRSR